jgi:hypothetical protein
MRRENLKVIYLTAYDIPGVADEALGPVLLSRSITIASSPR